MNLNKILIYISLCMICFSSAGSEPEKNYYEILSVPSTASQKEIRDAWVKLSIQHHPDRNIGDETANERMAEINAAYGVLKDPDLRKEYDELIQTTRIQEGFDFEAEVKATVERQAFYSAVSKALSGELSLIRRIGAFEQIAQTGLELNHRQVRAILHIVTLGVTEEHEFVRRAAIKALARYVDQLFIEDIDLLLLLSSSANKIDDRDLQPSLKERLASAGSRFSAVASSLRGRDSAERGSVIPSSEGRGIVASGTKAVAVADDSQNETVLDLSNETVLDLSIKQKARNIAQQWLKTNFEHPAQVNQIIEMTVTTDAGKELKYFREFILQALDGNEFYLEKLNSKHIQLLQEFEQSLGFRQKKDKSKVKSIIRKWNRKNLSSSTAVTEYSGGKNLVRFDHETQEERTDPVLYSIHGVDDAISYFKNNPNLPSERVQQIADYTLSYLLTYRDNYQWLSYLARHFPSLDMTKTLDQTISYLGGKGASEASHLVENHGSYFSQQHFIQLLYQMFPFYQAQRGIRHGFFILKAMWEYLDDGHKMQAVHILKSLSVKDAEHGEGFISVAGNYLSEEDRRRIRGQGRALGVDSSSGGGECAGHLGKLD